MVNKLIQFDQYLFSIVNGYHTPWWDYLMLALSNRKGYYILFPIWIYFIYQKFGFRTAIYLTLGVAGGVGLSDVITSGIMKPYFHRLRPCYDLSLNFHVVTPKGCGSKYGFVSSHASNSFVIATFLGLLFRNTSACLALLFWAGLVAFSRVSLGKHYPLDIVVGGLIGWFIGYLLYQIYKRYKLI